MRSLLHGILSAGSSMCLDCILRGAVRDLQNHALLGCRLLGESNENLGRIVGILGRILARGSGKDSLVEPETYQKMLTLMQQMHSSLPAPVWSPPCPYGLCCKHGSGHISGCNNACAVTPVLIAGPSARRLR